MPLYPKQNLQHLLERQATRHGGAGAGTPRRIEPVDVVEALVDGGALSGESLVITALFGFNVGVEVGQLIVVCALAFLFFVTRKRRRLVATPATNEAATPPTGLVSAPTRAAASGIVAVVALYWFAERAGWV